MKKARGLNKKIVNPVDQRKKSILEFCYVLYGQGSIPLAKWLSLHDFQQVFCGLINVPHAKDLYAVFYDHSPSGAYKGILRKENATTVLLSSIPKGEQPVAYLYFNKDGFAKYCKDYKEYWDWVTNRNESRYQNNIDRGKNYDSKNMMHTFRLLDMAIEILTTGQIHVKRPNREELLRIRKGESNYEDLIEKAEAKMRQVEEAYAICQLPEQPDEKAIQNLLIQLRNKFYYAK